MTKNAINGKIGQRSGIEIMKRDNYLNKLISSKHINLIKVITGIRRSGKSYLLDSNSLDL